MTNVLATEQKPNNHSPSSFFFCLHPFLRESCSLADNLGQIFIFRPFGAEQEEYSGFRNKIKMIFQVFLLSRVKKQGQRPQWTKVKLWAVNSKQWAEIG